MNKTANLIKEYDLNIFYEDLGEDIAEVLTIQPSAYQVDGDWVSNRQYLESFKLTLAETRMIAPDFPVEDWGTDFFITLDSFESMVKVMPNRVKDVLSTLPDIETIEFEGPEYKWLDTLF